MVVLVLDTTGELESMTTERATLVLSNDYG